MCLQTLFLLILLHGMCSIIAWVLWCPIISSFLELIKTVFGKVLFSFRFLKLLITSIFERSRPYFYIATYVILFEIISFKKEGSLFPVLLLIIYSATFLNDVNGESKINNFTLLCIYIYFSCFSNNAWREVTAPIDLPQNTKLSKPRYLLKYLVSSNNSTDYFNPKVIGELLFLPWPLIS